jgi:hypothetical protein
LRSSRDGDLLQNEIFTTIFNEVFLIGNAPSVKRSEPKSCVFPSLPKIPPKGHQDAAPMERRRTRGAADRRRSAA